MRELIKDEFRGWKVIELMWLAVATLVIVGLSLYWHDTAIGIVSALTGVLCVVATGKGKLSAYLFGIINTILYAYLAYSVSYFGDFALNAFYFLPMQFIGFYMWKNHMNKKTAEVKMRRLDNTNKIKLVIVSITAIIIFAGILGAVDGRLPIIDSTSTVLSVIAMWLSVKRYAEQWALWIAINCVTIYMWLNVFLVGGESIATLAMWMVYLINSIIMYIKWNETAKEAERCTELECMEAHLTPSI